MHKDAKRAAEIIGGHFRENLTVDDICGAVHLSKAYFIRMFKAEVGFPPMAFMRQLRVREACRRLLSTSDAVGDIARDVGYKDVTAFGMQFKKTTGLSPSGYRVAHGNWVPGCR